VNRFKAYYLTLFFTIFSLIKAENNDYFFFYNLNAGANLLSFPLLNDNNDIEIFFDNTNTNLISNFNIPENLISVISEGQISLFNEDNWVGSLDEISSNKGYWLILDEPISFLYNGSVIDYEFYSLHPGSNLISYPFNTEQSIYDVLPFASQDMFSAIIGQNESLLVHENQFYGSLNTFKPGHGYWFIAHDYSFFNYLNPVNNNSSSNTYNTLDTEISNVNQSVLQSIYFIESIYINGIENTEEKLLTVSCGDNIAGQKNWKGKFSDLIAMGNDGYDWTTNYCEVNESIKIKDDSLSELYFIKGSDKWIPNNYSIITLSNADLGDINFDQTKNIGDIIIMIEHITDINPIDNEHAILLSDINSDQIINISDIIINIEDILEN
jgi:hypothetical protein